MTDPTQGKPMDAITSLLAERQRYESWIATLETRKATTPPHVYARVRADYEKRLMAILDQLTGRTSELESAVSGLATRVSELMQDETAKRDERAEAELRAAVGEFTAAEWEELSQKSAAEIARLEALRNEVGSELAAVQELLLQATRKSDAITPPESAPAIAAPAPVAAQPVAQPPAQPPAQPAPQPAAAPRPQPAPQAPAARPMADFVQPPPARLPGSAPAPRRPGSSPDFDELAFLKSVVDPREAGGQAAARSAGPTGPASSAPLPKSAGDDLSALLSGGRESPSFGSSSRPASPGIQRPTTSSQPTEAPSDFPTGEMDRLSKSVPAFLKDVPAEQAKTLKCQECGTMNYPTEWYCERCGGELAAM